MLRREGKTRLRVRLPIATAFIIVAAVACARPRHRCVPTGRWDVEDRRTTASGGICLSPSLAFIGTTVEIAAASSAGFLSWSESPNSFSAAFDSAGCLVMLQPTFVTTQVAFDGHDYVLTIVENRNLVIDGDEIHGMTTLAASTDHADPDVGLSCTSTYETLGHRR